jgi:predicted MFS family arabinose efflux permease
LAGPAARTLSLQVLAFTATRVVLNTMHRMVYPFLPVFGRGLGVDLAALSLALTFRSTAGAFGPFLASVADSRGRKAGMLFGLLLYLAGVSLVVFWPVYPAFLLALILTMLGKYVFDPSMQAYLGDRVSYRRRGLVLAVTEVGWSLSFIAGVPLMGLLIARGGWMAPFPLLALLGLLAIVMLSWLLPRDPAPLAGRPGLMANFRSLLTYAPALAGLAMGLSFSAANEVVNLVFGVWMEDSFGLKIAALGAASAVIGLSELGGESLAAGLVDRLGKTRAVGSGLVLNGLAALALPFLGLNLAGAVAGLFLFYITFEFTLVCSIPLMTEILPAARATLMAANSAGLSLGRALGALLAPSLYGLGTASPMVPDLFASAMAAVLFNIVALLALRFLRQRIGSEE